MARQKLTAEEKAARAAARKLARLEAKEAAEQAEYERRQAIRRADRARIHQYHREWVEAGCPISWYAGS